MSERQRISVVILTKNEEARIERCLRSVQWADEIVVVDGMSTDRTIDICRAFGARVISHAFEGSFAQERNIGIAHAQGDWVLQIDADDIVTDGFRIAVENILTFPSRFAAFKFRRKSYFLGRFMRYGGWYHYLPNLVRRDAVRYVGRVYERPVVRGAIGLLDTDIEHRPVGDLGQFLDRQNRYTSILAGELAEAFTQLSPKEVRSRLIREPLKAFWKTYVKKQGFREGMHGLVFSLFYAGIELIKWTKCWERCFAISENAQEKVIKPVITQVSPPIVRGKRQAKLSVVLMTKNEEGRLARCLDRVAGWADEIVIVDDLSTDRTVEVARCYTDQVISMASEDNHDLQWNRGIDRASGEWILHIDADELVTQELRAAIDQTLDNSTGHSAFTIMRKNFFLGHPMRYGGWYHRHLVLFRRDRARCTGSGIHVQLRVDGTVGQIDAGIEHYPFESLAQFIERQNRYTSVEARVRFAAGELVPLRTLVFQLCWRPIKLFRKSYVKHRGHREGFYGLVFGLLYAFVHILFWVKLWELGYLRDQRIASIPNKANREDTSAAAALS